MGLKERAAARQRRRDRRAARQVVEVPAASQPVSTAPSPISNSPFVNLQDQAIELSRYHGACFLLLSGPSAKTLDLSQLTKRGIFVATVNNSGALFRPNLVCYVDRPNKIHNALWLDPAVIKSVPIQHAGPRRKQKQNTLSAKLPDGTFTQLYRDDGQGNPVLIYPRDCPNVIFHRRNAFFRPETWLSEASINWGNSKTQAIRNGKPHALNVMFCALKTIYSLGFRTVFLLGCDFKMNAAQPYAINEGKPADACAANNEIFGRIDKMMHMLAPSFDEASFRVYNTNYQSGLTAFPFVEYDEAIKAATNHIPQDPLDCSNWYELR